MTMTKKKPDITPKMEKLATETRRARNDFESMQSLCLTLDVFLARAKKDCIARQKKYDKAYDLWMKEIQKEAKKQGVK